jgi:uncharacterized protein DUF6252
VNGADFSAHLSTISTSGVETIGISGTQDQASIFLSVPSNIVEGTYSFDEQMYRATYSLSGVDYYGSGNGTIVISEHDKANKKIKGTFQFTGVKYNTTSTVSVTEGSFEGNYF